MRVRYIMNLETLPALAAIGVTDSGHKLVLAP